MVRADTVFPLFHNFPAMFWLLLDVCGWMWICVCEYVQHKMGLYKFQCQKTIFLDVVYTFNGVCNLVTQCKCKRKKKQQQEIVFSLEKTICCFFRTCIIVSIVDCMWAAWLHTAGSIATSQSSRVQVWAQVTACTEFLMFYGTLCSHRFLMGSLVSSHCPKNMQLGRLTILNYP